MPKVKGWLDLPLKVRGEGQHLTDWLYLELRSAILEGSLSASARLPSTRDFAAQYGLSRGTIVQVFERLQSEGYLSSRVGAGTVISSQVMPRPPSGPDAGTLPAYVRNIRANYKRPKAFVGLSPACSLRPFRMGDVDLQEFPSKLWARLASRRARSPGSWALPADDLRGYQPLRQAIAGYLGSSRGIACAADQITIVSGVQQALDLLARLLLSTNDKIWLEDPGYWGARSVFSAGALKLVPVGVDGEGLAPTLEQLRQPPRLMFVSPSHQYPTGALMSHGRRRQLLEYAAAHGVWVVEDDYDSEFRYGARPLPALQGLDAHGRVIYLGTFSKTLFPALRLAYLVLPPDLVDAFARALNELFREGQTMQQAVLARFLAEGHYATHIRRMRAVYSARHDALMDAITRHFGAQVPVIGGDAGLHLTLGLGRLVDDDAVAQHAQRAGVTTRPLSLYHMRRPAAAKGLLLGYGCVREEEIAPSFAKLARVLRAYL